MRASLIFLLIVLIDYSGFSQEISGTVLDAKTKAPIETAVIYFDNTTKGTVTNSNGRFSIEYSDAIQSPLIISFLGYKKQIIKNYRTLKSINIQLEEAHELLNEVLINANDGLTREEKLKVFRKEFLGSSKYGKSCTILNEDVIKLKYIKKEQRLIAHSTVPLKIKNLGLQYLVTYNLSSFSAQFSHSNPKKNNFEVNAVGFLGNPYYQNISNFNNKKALINRKKVFQGSTYHFMRALYSGNLEKEKFKIFHNKIKVDIKNVFDIEFYNNTAIKKVTPNKKSVIILFKNKHTSKIEVLTPYFLVDVYGNYTKVPKINFSGYLGSKRFGDLLPLDYGL